MQKNILEICEWSGKIFKSLLELQTETRLTESVLEEKQKTEWETSTCFRPERWTSVSDAMCVYLQKATQRHYRERELSIQTLNASKDELQGQGSGPNPCDRDRG